MIQGVIDENKPLISIEVGWIFGLQRVDALVDTGFTGDLKISQNLALGLGMEIIYAGSVLLGNNEEVVMEGSNALICMEGISMVVEVLVSKGEAVIGVELLRKFGYELQMNPRINRLVLQQ